MCDDVAIIIILCTLILKNYFFLHRFSSEYFACNSVLHRSPVIEKRFSEAIGVPKRQND